MKMIKTALDFVVKSIVDSPNRVHIEESVQDDQQAMYEISVAESDRGKVIGKDGKTIRALRGLAQSLSDESGASVVLKGDNLGQ